ncbi:hypothetical protein CANMA_004093 [Candida margitis]|uniref:uncharacterized protein n=1 Tax=Candida margitis TaxID=1775924 RepID=UPI0022276718|nr:uncharacterized protein CANMA_004093 [Candida margitis]KAI5959657.1 hypothetical protein CANMA_004093 [Candida margitis]
MHFLSLFLVLNTAFCFPLQIRTNSFNAGDAYKSVLNSTWDLFWNEDHQAFNLNDPNCNSNFSNTAVWDLAVVGKAFFDSGDANTTQKILTELYKYQSPSGWFNAQLNQGESYTDDNAQIVWALLAAYDVTKDDKYLTSAEHLVDLIQGQWSSIGGIIWQTGKTYVASISTTEAALAAVRLYKYNQDQKLLDFAEQCLAWMEAKLTNPSDGFYYDGLDENSGNINKGKLSYTVGTAISSYAYLHKFTNNDTYLDLANKKATAALATNSSNIFMNSDGGWNNSLKYVHLLFAGIADLIEIGSQSQYSQKLVDQGNFVYQFDQLSEGDYADYNSVKTLADHYTSVTGKSSGYSYSASVYCNGTESEPQRSVLNQGSAAQVFYQVNRISS